MQEEEVRMEEEERRQENEEKYLQQEGTGFSAPPFVAVTGRTSVLRLPGFYALAGI